MNLKKGILSITLLSDACISSGETYNASIDTDICYDRYGIPNIPGKRIKGCLKEAGMELRDWGIKWDDDVTLDAIFGRGGGKKGSLQISRNAKIKDYLSYRNALIHASGEVYAAPQNVLSYFSELRSQTRINANTGTADPHSLRTSRTMNKGLVFQADISIDSKYKEALENCINCVIGMGVNRTRGMGCVEMSIEWDKSLPKESTASVPYQEGATCLDYQLKLNSPLVLKTVDGGQIKTQNYIEGGKILGYIAEHCDDFIGFMQSGELHASNAYPTIEGKRSIPVSAGYFKKKNSVDEIVNKLAESTQEVNEQLSGLGEAFVECDGGKTVKTIELETEIRYHHSRPDDKGIGRAVKTSPESQLYQIQSVSEGQSFSGYLTGSVDQIKKVYDIMKEDDFFTLGGNRSAEYGAVSISITGLGASHEKKEEITKVKDFILKLNAPVILYNKNGMYSTDVHDLVDEVEKLVGKSLRYDSEKVFMKYTVIGGYNVTWGAKKPTIRCFDKGSVIWLSADEPFNLNSISEAWIGERTSEGFGEVMFSKLESDFEKKMITCVQEFTQDETSYGEAGTHFLRELADQHQKACIEQLAREQANKKEMVKTISANKDAVNPLVNIMLLLLKEEKKKDNGSWKGFVNEMKERYQYSHDSGKKKKYELAEKFWKKPEKYRELEPEHIKDQANYWYLKAFLLEVKYLLRSM